MSGFAQREVLRCSVSRVLVFRGWIRKGDGVSLASGLVQERSPVPTWAIPVGSAWASGEDVLIVNHSARKGLAPGSL